VTFIFNDSDPLFLEDRLFEDGRMRMNKRARLKKLRDACSSAVLTMLLLSLAACAFAQEEERYGVHRYKRVEWQEQVRFSTGQVIVLKRGERARLAYGGQLPPDWLFDEAWLEADLPGVGRARWDGSLSPLVLDVTPTGEWYLLGVVAANRGHRDYSVPEHKRYVAFKLSSSTWQRVPFSQFPESFKPNLLANTHRLFWKENTPSGTLVTFEMKRRVDSNPTLGRAYRIIDRSLGE
jgi:hypothetical protein